MAYFRHSIENCVICFVVVVIVVVDLMVMVLLLLYYSKVDSQSQNNQEEEEHVEPTVVYQEEGMLSSAMILESHCMWLTALLFVCMFTRGLLDSVFCIVCKFFVKKHKFYCYIRSVTLYFLHILYHNFFLFFRFRWGTACTYWGWTLGVWCKFSDL